MSRNKSENQITQPNDGFFDSVAKLVEKARAHIGRTADLAMCVTYYEIGRMIVEQEQDGKARAKYGSGLLKELSLYLKERFGKGFSETTLKNARKFYQVYTPSIQQEKSARLADERKGKQCLPNSLMMKRGKKGKQCLLNLYRSS